MQGQISIAEQVQNGVDVLDEKIPRWREKINVNILDIASTALCVVGQLYEEEPYTHGVSDLLGRGYNADDARYHGFAAYMVGDYEKLTEEWKLAISS